MGLYDYMTPEELEYAKESAQIDNEALKFEHQFQILALEHESRINDIDTRALLDNYTEAVLEDAYAAELRVYEEGVAEAWEKFKTWFINLINAILGKTQETKEEVKPEDEGKKVKLKFDISFVKSKIEEIANDFKNIFKKENGEVDWAKVAIGAITGTGAVAGFSALMKHINEGKEHEVTVKDANSLLDVFNKALNKIKSIFGQHKHEEGDSTTGASKIINAVQKIVNDIRAAIHTAIGKAGEAAQKAGKAVAKNAAIVASNIKHGKKNKDEAGESEMDPASIGEATNDLLASMDDISFYEESASIDLIMETVSEEDMKEIDSLLESL